MIDGFNKKKEFVKHLHSSNEHTRTHTHKHKGNTHNDTHTNPQIHRFLLNTLSPVTGFKCKKKFKFTRFKFIKSCNFLMLIFKEII